MLEPVQGEGGFIPMPPEFSTRCGALRRRTGSSTSTTRCRRACGRTGTVWAIEHYGVEPDLLVSGKSLGGGLPLAAVTGRAELMDAVAPGGLGGTFGGNPVACAAALAVLDELSAPGFRERAEQIGALLRTRLDEHRRAHADRRRGARARRDARARARRDATNGDAANGASRRRARENAGSCSSRAASTAT